MYERPHHQRIARILAALDAELLQAHACLFGGGTCIALRCGEYRESVDIDFLIADADGYRELRQLLTSKQGLAAITRTGAIPLIPLRELRADQYGIRTQLQIDNEAIKFEIVREARFSFDLPRDDDRLCDIATLSGVDLAASKLLANADRYADDSVFSRDLIDLAMLELTPSHWKRAFEKAEAAYGTAIRRDLDRAIERIRKQPQWLTRCQQAMAITLPQALLWQRIRKLERAGS